MNTSETEPSVDYGKDVLTGLAYGAMKLWIYAPPTPHNLALFVDCYNSESKFTEIIERLEHVEYAVTDEPTFICLAPGTLHSTATACGGPTLGIEFSLAQSLEMTVKMYT